MSKMSHPCPLKRRPRIQASLCLALFLLCLQPVRGATFRAPASSVPMQSKVMVVGILSFHDESDSGAPPELGKKIALQLKQRLSLSFKDVLPKSLSGNSDATSTEAQTVEQVVALGKQNAVQFVVRGGVLSLAVTESNITAQLYAEIISVESGAVSVVRAEGTAPGGTIQWSKIDLNSASFFSSAPGTALAVAIESLATSIHQALLTPIVAASPDETSADSVGTAETASPVDAAAANSDEELQQLIAQAEEVVASGAGDTDRLASVNSGLQKLKAALVSKASLIERGADATGSDQEIEAAKTEIQAALTALNEQTASAEASSEALTPPTGEKKSVLGAIDQRASEALGLLQKIQEMRAAIRGVREGSFTGNAGPEGAPLEAVEQPTEDVSGVVMQDGQPVAGVEVSDKDWEVSAITGPDGSYTLKGLPAGKLSKLVLKKNGKQLATGQLDLVPKRAAVADFNLKTKMAPDVSALRVIPSSVVVSSKAAATGTIKGTAKDKNGKPLPRALVQLQGLGAVARTGSDGGYSFYKVPVGERVVVIQSPGFKPVPKPVFVKSGQLSAVQSQLTTSLPKAGGERQRAIVPGTGTNLRGRVLDTDGKPLAGAKVLLLKSNSAAAVQTSRTGEYQFKDLRPGTGTLLATRAGYENGKLHLGANMSATESLDFRLKRLDSSHVAKAINSQNLRQSSRLPTRSTAVPVSSPAVPVRSSASPGRPARGPGEAEAYTAEGSSEKTSSNRSGPTPVGEVSGRVVDAATRRPIAGATITIRGRRVRTSEIGSFSLTNLAPGNYQINVTSTGFVEEQRSVSIRAGASSREEFVLKRVAAAGAGTSRAPNAPANQPAMARMQMGQLRGRVIDTTGVPVAGAVVAMSAGQSTVSGRDGSFAVNALAPGSYQVLVRRTGFADRRGEVRIKSGEVTTATFNLMSLVRRPN